MIGCGAVGHPPATPLRLAPGDLILLTTDGFHKFVAPDSIESLAEDWLRRGAPLSDLAERLTQEARANGSYDDITVLLLWRRSHRNGLWTLGVAGWLVLFMMALVLFGDGPACPVPVPAHHASVPPGDRACR
jgi:hypothetical protein